MGTMLIPDMANPGGSWVVSDTLTYENGGWAYQILGRVDNAPLASAPAGGSLSASTGVSPLETSYSLYGHPVPLSVFGVGRIGGEIISGPWVENGLASFIISFGVPADPSGSRDIREIAFDSEVVWTTNGATGRTTPAGGTFTVEAIDWRFYQGTLTQAADTLESTHFGAAAVAYRPQILLAFSNLPIASTKFRKIPYVAAVIGDGTGNDVNLGEAFERIAYSPYVGLTSAEFATSGITDGLVDGGLIFTSNAEFLSTIQLFNRFYPTWDILQTDKLRIVDRGTNLTPDISLDKSTMSDSIVMGRQGPDSIKRALELSTIDPDADYTIIPFKAELPRQPVSVSTAVGTDAVYLPAIMEASTRAAVATLAKFHEENSRKSISGTMMAYGLEIEPGDLIRVTDLGDDFGSETFKVSETLHGANYVVEFSAVPLLRCAQSDTSLALVMLLMGFEGADGSKGAPGLTDEGPQRQGTALSPNDSQIDTAQKKFGNSSLLITGSSPAVIFPTSADFNLSAANADQFTVEAWIRLNAFTNPFGAIVGGVQEWRFCTLPSNELRFHYTNSASVDVDIDTSGAALTTSVWYFVAVDKDATGKIRIYRGTAGGSAAMIGSSTPANSAFLAGNVELMIGGAGLFGIFSLDGWIDELRISKGVARYASDGGFTVPTSAFPRS